VPKDGETVAGNPNTLYGFVGFNDSTYQLVPPDYPPFDWPPDQPSGAFIVFFFSPNSVCVWKEMRRGRKPQNPKHTSTQTVKPTPPWLLILCMHAQAQAHRNPNRCRG
jgi:hypothetical protein